MIDGYIDTPTGPVGYRIDILNEDVGVGIRLLIDDRGSGLKAVVRQGISDGGLIEEITPRKEMWPMLIESFVGKANAWMADNYPDINGASDTYDFMALLRASITVEGGRFVYKPND